MLSRIFLIASITFGIMATTLLSATPANATRPTSLPTCDFGGFNWQAKLDEKIPDWKTPGYSVLIAKITESQFVALFVMKGSDASHFNELVYVPSDGTWYGSHRGASGGALWLGYDNGSEVDFDTAWSNQRGGSQVHCVSAYSGNLRLATTDGSNIATHFPDFDPVVDIPNATETPPVNNSNPNNCDPWDVVCWFQNVVGNVVDGFQSLGDLISGSFQAIGDWIANLIMPQNEDGTFSNNLETSFFDIKTGFEDRLGFLLFPFQFIGELFTGILEAYNPTGSDWTTCPPSLGLTIPNLLGSNGVTLDICTLEDVSPTIYTTMIAIIRIVWIIGVVGFLHHKYFQIVRS